MTRIIFELQELRDLCQGFNKCLIVSSLVVWELHGKKCMEMFNEFGMNPVSVLISDSEAEKTIENWQNLQLKLLENGADKQTLLIAIGGGVVTDIAGFAASTLHRGMPLCHIPTTLLGMVDAAIGGKNGVNTPFGKNSIGSFYLPGGIFIYPPFLETLPESGLLQGVVESIKHGAIKDKELFNKIIEKLPGEICELGFLKSLIKKSMQVKLDIIKEDLDEKKGLRHLLNFGHTLGHAFELYSGFKMPHGTAVALGMIGEAFLSYQADVMEESEFLAFEKGILKLNLKLEFPKFNSFHEFQNFLRFDKKCLGGKARFVLLEKIGKPHVHRGQYCHYVEERVLKKFYDKMIER